MPDLPPELPDDFTNRPESPGEAAARLRERFLECLLELAPGGCEALAAAATEDEPGSAPGLESLERAFPRWGARALRELELAQGWIEELRDLSPGQRLVRVANASSGFRGRAFELRLLAEARTAGAAGDPAVGLAWAELAERAVVCSEVTLPTETWLLAQALQALMHERSGHEERVPPLLDRIDAQLATSAGCLGPDGLAELLLVVGTLHTDRGEPERARELLPRAVLLWYSLRQVDCWLRSLLELARADLAAGDLEAAYDAWHLAAVVHQAGRDPEFGDLVRSLGSELRARGALPAPPSPEWPERPGREGREESS